MADDQDDMTQDELAEIVRKHRLEAMERSARANLKEALALKREAEKIMKRDHDQGGRAV